MNSISVVIAIIATQSRIGTLVGVLGTFHIVFFCILLTIFFLVLFSIGESPCEGHQMSSLLGAANPIWVSRSCPRKAQQSRSLDCSALPEHSPQTLRCLR